MMGFFIAGLVGVVIGLVTLIYIAFYQEQELKRLDKEFDFNIEREHVHDGE